MLVDQGEHPNRPAVAGAIGDEVVAPDVILIGWAQPHARSVGEPQSLPFRLLLRDFQPLLTPETLDAFVIDRPALVPQQRRHPAIAVTAVLAREFHDPFEQARLVAGDMPLPTLRAAMLIQYLARCDAPTPSHVRERLERARPQGVVSSGLEVSRGGFLQDRLASSASANRRFSRAFSFSSSFSRFAWSIRRPPYSFFQR